MSIKSTPTIMTDDELQADIFRQVYPNREPLFPIIMLDVANTARPRAAQRLHLTTNASLAVFAFATLVAILAFFWPYGYETLQHPCPCAVHGYTGRRSLSAKHIPLSWQPVFGKAAHKVDKYWLNWLAVPPILPAKKFRDTEEFKAALPEADQDGYKQLLRYFIENTNTKTKPLDLKTTRKRTSESLQNATLAYKPIRQCIKNAAPKLLSNIESWEFPATDVFLATRAPPFASLFPNDVSLTCRFSLAQLASQPFAATVAMVGYLDDLTRGRSMRLLETSEYLSDMEDILNFLWKHMEQQYWTTQQNASVSVSEYFDRTASWPYLTAYNTLPNLHDLQLDRLQDVQKYYIALSFFDLALFEARRYVTNELARTGQLQNASATFLEQEEAKHAQLPRSWWTNFWRPVFNLAPLRQMHFLRFREAVLDQGATRNASSLTDGPAEEPLSTCGWLHDRMPLTHARDCTCGATMSCTGTQTERGLWPFSWRRIARTRFKAHAHRAVAAAFFGPRFGSSGLNDTTSFKPRFQCNEPIREDPRNDVPWTEFIHTVWVDARPHKCKLREEEGMVNGLHQRKLEGWLQGSEWSDACCGG